MQKSNFLKVIETTKVANKIVGNARNEMFKTSFNTAKQIAFLYKDAGFEAFKIGKSLFTKTVKLTVDTQKELLATSGQAFKDTAKAIRESEIQLKAEGKKVKKKKGKANKAKKKSATKVA